MPGPAPTIAEGQAPASLDAVVRTAVNESRPGDNVYIQIPEQPGVAYKVYLMADADTNTVRGLDLDPATGRLLSKTETPDLEPMVRVLALAVSLHQGKTFGMPSKIIAFLTCLALIGLSITGVWMWWQRRPQGRSGFPAAPEPASVPKWTWSVAVVLGVLLPVAGVSMLLFMAGELLVRRMRKAPSLA
jgi:uncharacterized iron-regulated membrane protein